MTRSALALLLALASLPTLWRALPARPRTRCQPEGRGTAPRHWVGCAGDAGPPRDLDGPERLALGLPVDVNRATAGDLAGVPGLTPRLAEAVVAERAARGAFATVDELVRVKGVGPARLARARPHLMAGAPPVEEWAARPSWARLRAVPGPAP